ncbi:30S ribosomal protein S1 [Streptomyces sp. NPDC127077]|uniref:30S ribosomal protein S1 n=1 Tax=Streptomyces sp. NPDC127077 TaxID=3347131 RepID=UPI00366203A3
MINSYEDAVARAEEILRETRRARVPDSLKTFTDRCAAGEVPVSGTNLSFVLRLAWLLYQMGLPTASHSLVQRLVSDPPQGYPPGGDPNRCAVLLTCLGRPKEAQRLLTSRHSPDTTQETTEPGEAARSAPRPHPASTSTPRGVDADPPQWATAQAIANLAAINASTGQPQQAKDWLAQAHQLLHTAGGTPPVEIRQLLAGVRVTLARKQSSDPVPEAVTAEFNSTSLAAIAALSPRDPQGYLIVAQLAMTTIEDARDHGAEDRLEHATGVLEAASQRLSAMLGADHPRALVVQGKLAAVHVECARAARSPLRLRKATAHLAFVSSRLNRHLDVHHPQALAAAGNLAVARLECARGDQDDQSYVDDLLQDLYLQWRSLATLVGSDHPVVQLVQASYQVCQTLTDRPAPLRFAPAPTTDRAHPTGGAHFAGPPPALWATSPTARTILATSGSTAAAQVQQAVSTTPHIAVNDIGNEEAFLAAIDETIKYFNDGDIVDGVIVKVDRDEVLLDIGYKTEGVIPSRELSIKHDVDPNEVVKVGDEIEALVLQKEDKEGRLILSKKRAQYQRAWGTIEKIKEEDGIVTGTVIEVVKGGLILDIGLRGFLPASLVEMRRVRNLQTYVGKELEAKIIELDKNRNNVILSRRAWLEQTQSEVRQTFLTTLQKGQVRSGVISTIVPFGAFVDLGGIDGLVHISELSWKHIDHPSEAVEVGQEVTVEVLDVDMDRERVSLSLKATQEDPWQQFARTHQIGQVVPGKVTKLVPFGAFVRVNEGIEGLVHISELAERHVEIPEQVIQANNEIFVKVIDIDLQRRRISLSLKQANESFNPEFDPTLYGMAASYDDQGNYIYPEGFDPETNDWLEGFESQREAWENQYAEAQQRHERHRAQVTKAREADAQAEAESATSTEDDQPAHSAASENSYSFGDITSSGALATDEALAALREKLTGGQKST